MAKISFHTLNHNFISAFNFLDFLANEREPILLDQCCDAMGASFIDIKMWSLWPKVWMSAWKKCAIVFELLTVLCTDAATSTGDPRVPRRLEGISGKHVQLVSANFKGALKICLLPLEVWSTSRSCPAAEGFGDIRGFGAECNHYKSVL